MRVHRKIPHRLTTLGLLALLGTPALTPALSADGNALGPTVSPVYNIWDPGTVVGTSRLIRTAKGISATLTSTDLPPGHALTMWFGVFNNPAACASNPCTWSDGDNPDVQLDFLYASGHVVGRSGRGTFSAHLKVGDPSGSAFVEFGGEGIGLLDPWNAEVHLLLHSHGPAQSGQLLKSQITSFLGGCEVFLPGPTPDFFASGPQDIPVNPGECSTFQDSGHP
jgi:hypothetical protein